MPWLWSLEGEQADGRLLVKSWQSNTCWEAAAWLGGVAWRSGQRASCDEGWERGASGGGREGECAHGRGHLDPSAPAPSDFRFACGILAFSAGPGGRDEALRGPGHGGGALTETLAPASSSPPFSFWPCSSTPACSRLSDVALGSRGRPNQRWSQGTHPGTPGRLEAESAKLNCSKPPLAVFHPTRESVGSSGSNAERRIPSEVGAAGADPNKIGPETSMCWCCRDGDSSTTDSDEPLKCPSRHREVWPAAWPNWATCRQSVDASAGTRLGL